MEAKTSRKYSHLLRHCSVAILAKMHQVHLIEEPRNLAYGAPPDIISTEKGIRYLDPHSTPAAYRCWLLDLRVTNIDNSSTPLSKVYAA